MKSKFLVTILAMVLGLGGGALIDRVLSPQPAAATAETEQPAPLAATPAPQRSADHGAARPVQRRRADTEPEVAQPASKTEAPAVDLAAVVAAAGPNALAAVAPYLADPNRKTRRQALAAVMQIDDRAISSRLQQLAAQTTDPAERAELLSAADFLNLPTPTEYFAAHGTNAAAKLITPPRTFGKIPIPPAPSPHSPSASQ